ncbi:Photosystem II repair PSB27-chloroplastic [Micractinium conductrix]|uniref:Photosystem II repair PSB27-chloroplastic n=1 Tax=Micractinium conductrix TaxID=554055 RepID=A0A2P6V3I5_9CHLO|nr:Photosystem II repair PSB27-chloroplastic [Micractinium conductrix]|eukprot:PSC68646.1 Photosystem II repair PSB27-chloroplastic [Micractinium conductrix]
MVAASVAIQRPFVPASAKQGARSGRRAVVTAAVQPQAQEVPQLARRGLLASGIALLAAPTASQAAIPSKWDGESSAIGSCPLGTEGTECRQQILLNDRSKLASYDQSKDQAAGKVGKSASGTPVADLSTAYAQDTVALTDKLLAYAAFEDPVDPARFAVIKELKAEMPKWVSKYARGGNVRAVSARKVYTVVDAISAHFTSNGLAPLPAAKLRKLVVELNEARVSLGEGSPAIPFKPLAYHLSGP